MAVREDQVEMAVKFLGNEKVISRPESEKNTFLVRKGLSQEEIVEAFRRYEKGTKTTTPASKKASEVPDASHTPSAQQQIASQSQQSFETQGSTPSYSPPAQHYPGQPYPGPSYPGVAEQAPWVNPYGPAPPASPWAYQGYGMPPNFPPQQQQSSNPWWAWLMGGLGVGLAGTMMVNALRPRSDDYDDSNGFFQAPSYQQPALKPQAQPSRQAEATEEISPLSPSPGTGGEPDNKASYDELVALLRQQSEEARENALMCAKALQTTQEQHQKTFAEMQKVLQSLQQQSRTSTKPQPTELSAATIQALATLIRTAQPDAAENSTADAATSSTSAAVTSAAAPAVLPQVTESNLPQPAIPAVSSTASAGTAEGPVAGLSLRESFEAINLSLQRLVSESNAKVEATKSLNTLAMILANLLKDPSSERNRKVNTTGARFSGLLRVDSAASELLKLAGFQYQEPNFIFSGSQTDSAQRLLDLLQDMQRNLDQAWNARPTVVETPSIVPASTDGSGMTAARPWATNPAQSQAQSSQIAAAAVSSPSSVVSVPSTVISTARTGQASQPPESQQPAIAHPAESSTSVPYPHFQANPTEQSPQQPQQSQQQISIAHPAETSPVTVPLSGETEGRVEERSVSEEPQTGG